MYCQLAQTHTTHGQHTVHAVNIPASLLIELEHLQYPLLIFDSSVGLPQTMMR